jgi:hypothetical protein
MRFFEGARPQVYIHGAKLRRDKKTGKRLWGLTLIVTMDDELVKSSADAIVRAYAYIRDLDNGIADMHLVAMAPSITIDFFAQIDDAAPVVHIERVDLGGMLHA